MKFKKLYALAIASDGFVPEYISSKIQKCLSIVLEFDKLSKISLHLLASAWKRLSRCDVSGIFI
jgi:hypothetical protein